MIQRYYTIFNPDGAIFQKISKLIYSFLYLLNKSFLYKKLNINLLFTKNTWEYFLKN